jgi:hypothetical protein
MNVAVVQGGEGWPTAGGRLQVRHLLRGDALLPDPTRQAPILASNILDRNVPERYSFLVGTVAPEFQP